MIQAYTQETTVQAGGKIIVASPDLPVGTKVQVVLLVNQTHPVSSPPGGGKSLSSFIGTGSGQFKSASEVDAFIRAERDAWEK